MMESDSEIFDLLGVGIGPFNLSLSALLSSIKTIKSRFFESKPSFSWHPGLLLTNSELQVSYLKDLVTLVDPTNPYTFIAYLVKHKLLYRFINAQFRDVSRVEYNNYLNWVSSCLPNLFFGEKVENIYYEQPCFILETTKRTLKGQHIVLGNGLTPSIPRFAKPHLGKNVFHSEDFLFHAKHTKAKRIAVIGGGQSSADVIYHLLADGDNLPREINWITKRSQFLPVDDSPFVKEFFSPNYAEYFFQLSAEKRSALLQEQRVVNDGISGHLLKAIYQRLYFLECIQKHERFFHMLPTFKLIDMQIEQNTQKLNLFSERNRERRTVFADIVIFATGYTWEFPDYLQSLKANIPLSQDRFCINPDFSIIWDGPNENRIYVQNAARHTYGIADPNLSLMAWRSAKIINSIAERTIYDLEYESTAIDWRDFHCTNELYPSLSSRARF